MSTVKNEKVIAKFGKYHIYQGTSISRGQKISVFTVYYSQCKDSKILLKDYVNLDNAIIHARSMNEKHPTVKGWEN